MEFNRESVIALYLAGKPQVAIVRALRHLNVNKSFVSRTIARYRDTGSVASRPKSGRKKTVTTPEMIRKVKAKIDQNPRRSGRKMARELNISRERLQHILTNELGLKPMSFQKVQALTEAAEVKIELKEFDEDDVAVVVSDEEKDNDNLENDGLIKAKKKPTSNAKASTSIEAATKKPTASKTKTTSKSKK